MNLERDLRAALQSLEGDPVADARRVLDALPDVGGVPGPALPKWFWWALGSVLAVGLGIGWIIGQAGAGDATPVEQPRDEKPQDKPKPPDPWADENYLVLMAFGQIYVEEPKQSRQLLEPGQYHAEIGAIVETGNSMAGIHVPMTDARIRLDRETVAIVDADKILLRDGRLWMSNVERPFAHRVEAEGATILADACELVVESVPTGVTVTVVDGEATVRSTGGGSRRLARGERVAIDPMGIPGSTETLPFLGSATSWMVKMILQQTDETELYRRAAEMVDAYVEGTQRDAATLELRRLGPRAVRGLYEAMGRMTDDAQLLHETARLIADIVDCERRDFVFALLEWGDEETRVQAFRGLVRACGVAVKDEEFWRRAPENERALQIDAWRKSLR